MNVSWPVRALAIIGLVTLLLAAAGAASWSRYALPWQGTRLERSAASRCSVPIGITYHVEVIPLENLPILVVRCVAIGYLARAAMSPMERMEAEGTLNTSPVVPVQALQLLADRSGWYLIEQRVLVDTRTLVARPAGITASPLVGP